MIATKYKLRITSRFGTARKPMRVEREFIWTVKQDALDCKALLDKAEKSKFVDVDFVEFTDEIPLV